MLKSQLEDKIKQAELTIASFNFKNAELNNQLKAAKLNEAELRKDIDLKNKIINHLID